MRRIAFYSYDEHGLGHVRRSIAIAHALTAAQPTSTLLVAGAREAALFKLPEGTDTLALPAPSTDFNGTRRGPDIGLDKAGTVRVRARALRNALAAFDPEVLIVDRMPLGVHDELRESLGVLRAMGTRLVLGLREILDDPDRVQAEFERSSAFDVLRRSYDAIWVYGDPRVYDLSAEYDLPEDIRGMVRFTGYLDRRAAERSTAPDLAARRRELRLPAGRIAACVLGGGEDGHALAAAFAPRPAAGGLHRRRRRRAVHAGRRARGRARPRRRPRRPARPRLRARRGGADRARRRRRRDGRLQHRLRDPRVPHARARRPARRAASRAGHPRPPAERPRPRRHARRGRARAGRDLRLAGRRRRRAPRPGRRGRHARARAPSRPARRARRGRRRHRARRASPTRRASCGCPRAARRAQGASRREARGALRARTPRRRATAGRCRPRTSAVPQLHGLLHRGAMASVLDRSLRSGAEIEDVRVTLVDYQPGSGATVAYDVAIAGARHVAVATAGHALCPEAVRTDARRAIARALGRHSPVARPLTYDVGLGALVQWYPLDLAMPVLARPVPELLRLVARAGIAAGSGGATPSTLVYRPGQRAVIRAGDVVLKAYAEDAAFRAGVAGLRIAAGLGLGAGPRLHGALPELRLTVQSALDGTPVPRARAREVAPIAGAMLGVLHDARLPGLAIAGSDRTLASAAGAARFAAAVAPGLARRTLDLLARLEEHAPDPDELVPSHGDFNISQLLDVEGAMRRARLRRGVPRAAGAGRHLVRSEPRERTAGRPRPRRRRARVAARRLRSAAACPALVSRGGAPAPGPQPVPAPQAELAAPHGGDRRCRRGGARAVKLVMLMSGFPRRSETFALNELLALDRAGCLEAVFATKPGEAGPPQPGAERLMEKVRVLAPGTAAEQAEEVVARLNGAKVSAVHGYFAHLPDRGRREGREPPRRPLRLQRPRRRRAQGQPQPASPTAPAAAACVHGLQPRRRRRPAPGRRPVQLMPHGVDLERFRPARRRPPRC